MVSCSQARLHRRTWECCETEALLPEFTWRLYSSLVVPFCLTPPFAFQFSAMFPVVVTLYFIPWVLDLAVGTTFGGFGLCGYLAYIL